ncbi:MAG TPA: tetratricopeptide repeat protein, partial [Tepidisphaeraceae bacterium]|nr:tetratricopeptide repeat protein [Tepidisphaeraceae bacterium]
TEKLTPINEGRVHLLLAESLDDAQKLHHVSVSTNHQRIVEQTRLAIAGGVKPDAETYRRLGESYEALDKTTDALESYRRAMAMDPRRYQNLQRKVVELQLTQPDLGPAEASIEEFLKNEKLADSERAWALQQKSKLLMSRQSYVDARPLLNESLRLSADPAAQGEANYRLGYCMWKLGDTAEAERLLRIARDQLTTAQPLDADAAYLLGKLRQDQNDPKEAITFYQAVLSSHPGSQWATLARLGRGTCRIILEQDAGGLSDLHDLANQVAGDKSKSADKAEILAGIRRSGALLSARQNYDGALELLTYEQTLQPEPAADFFERLAVVYERRADQMDRTLPDSPNAVERIRRQQQVRDLRTKAGDAYIAYSRSLTLSDDKLHAEAMWKGVDLYDRAGNLQLVTSALELFAAERPEDGQAPDALLRLGRAYQAAGLFDRAVGAFERNQLRYPQSLAASKSGVPLAQAYIAKGPEYYGRAEKVLLGELDSPLLGPDAEEFEQALFELSHLYYRTGRYDDAVIRLGEMAQRYPNDPRMAQVIFLMADSYRKSAVAIEAKPGSGSIDQDSRVAHRDRIGKAKKLYEKLVDMFHDTNPAGEMERLYLKLSYFYRADCLYDLQSYEEAITAYDAAAMRYQDDSSALSAYVQIVNAYCEEGKFLEAKRANERAKTLLARMPSDAFNDGAFSMPKSYWQKWLKWTSDAGMWNGLEDEKQAAQRLANGGQ